jgi:hypothetical protein
MEEQLELNNIQYSIQNVSIHEIKMYIAYLYCYCLWGGIAQGVPYTVTITDLSCFPVRVLIIPDSPTSLCQQQTEIPSSKAGETWQEMSMNFSYKYLFNTLGIFNMPQNLTTWNHRLYFTSEGSCGTGFYHP